MAELAGHFTQIALAETYREDSLHKTLDSFLITPSFGAVWYTDVDLGFPEVRASVSALPGANGTFDETRYHGARSVSMGLIILEGAFSGLAEASGWDASVPWDSANYWLSRLGAWMLPESRYRLYVRKKGLGPRWLDVRPAGMSAPITIDSNGSLAVQLQWANPSGRMYSFNDTYDPAKADLPQSATRDGRHRKDVRVFGTPVPGRTYPETAPYVRDYPTPPRGTDSLVYGGTAPTGFIVRMHAKGSPLVNPRLTLTAPDGSAAGSIGVSYTAIAGDFIEIDTEKREVTLNGLPAARLNQYVAAPLRWPQLHPGRDPLTPAGVAGIDGFNRIEFSADTFDTAAFAEVAWYDAFLH